MRWAPVIAIFSTWLGACTILVDTSGLSEPQAGTVSDGASGDGAPGDGAAGDAAAGDGAADALRTDVAQTADAAPCVKSGSGCSSDQECCSKKCGAFPFVFCK